MLSWRDPATPGGFSVRIAMEAVRHNRLRAALTSLGILFGVASVIAMLAIGKGAEQEILEQMRPLRSNNGIVTPLVEQKEGDAKDDTEKEPKKYPPGLTYADARAIARIIPDVEPYFAQLPMQPLVRRVEFLGTIDGDLQDAVVVADVVRAESFSHVCIEVDRKCHCNSFVCDCETVLIVLADGSWRAATRIPTRLARTRVEVCRLIN